MKDEWTELGKMQASDGDDVSFNSFSLDMTYFENKGKHYVIWAEIIGDSSLFMAEIDPREPNKLISKPILLTKPEYDWEKVVFRMCQMETYLSNRAFSVSGLLNKIAQIIGNDEQLGEIIESILEMSAVTNIKAFDAPKRVKVSEIQWAEKLWNPVKEQLSQSLNIKMSIPKDKGYSHFSSEAIKGAIYTFSYSIKSGVAAVSLETFGGEEIKRVVEQKIATAPADHPIRSAVVSQGKKNKNKWNWSIQINIDKYDPTLIQWYVDTVLSMYTLLEK